MGSFPRPHYLLPEVSFCTLLPILTQPHKCVPTMPQSSFRMPGTKDSHSINKPAIKHAMNHPSPEHKEPEVNFIPLNEKRYSEFYSIEMEGFTADIPFYKKHCKEGSTILEIGCGTGRISNTLAMSGYHVTGIDTSATMLRQAMRHGRSLALYLRMDAREMAFQRTFDHILLPYNLINLLHNTKCIEKCLRQARHLLKPNGSILLQIYIPDKNLIRAKRHRLFQFQTLPLPNNQGVLIKETLRSYNNFTQEIRMEERYRYRPIDRHCHEDFINILHFAGFSAKQWIKIIQACGFYKTTLFSGYDSLPYCPDKRSTLILKAFPFKQN